MEITVSILKFFYGVFTLLFTAFCPLWTGIICSKLEYSAGEWFSVCIPLCFLGLALLIRPIVWGINTIKG